MHFVGRTRASDVLDEIRRSKVVRDRDGNEFPLRAQIDSESSTRLFDLIASNSQIEKTLEVGCAYGLSALTICSALSHRARPRHIIVDPLQTERWNSIGMANLERAGCTFFELIEQGSEFALPELARREAATFDLVFIDGFHTFCRARPSGCRPPPGRDHVGQSAGGHVDRRPRPESARRPASFFS